MGLQYEPALEPPHFFGVKDEYFYRDQLLAPPPHFFPRPFLPTAPATQSLYCNYNPPGQQSQPLRACTSSTKKMGQARAARVARIADCGLRDAGCGLRVADTTIDPHPATLKECISSHPPRSTPRDHAGYQLLNNCLICAEFARQRRLSRTARNGAYRGTSLIRNRRPLRPYSRTMLRALWGS